MRRLIVVITSHRWLGPAMLAINLAIPFGLLLYFWLSGHWPTGPDAGGNECGWGRYKDC